MNELSAAEEVDERYLAYLPDLQEPEFVAVSSKFANYLRLQSNIRMPNDVPTVNAYIGDLTLLTVERKPLQDAQINMCWYNCRDYVRDNPGSAVVFGWQILHLHHNREKFAICAYHHAVISEHGNLVDITPYAVKNDDPFIQFVPDSRVPYDFKDNRTPLALFWSLMPQRSPFWTVEPEYPYSQVAPGYAVGRPKRVATQD